MGQYQPVFHSRSKWVAAAIRVYLGYSRAGVGEAGNRKDECIQTLGLGVDTGIHWSFHWDKALEPHSHLSVLCPTVGGRAQTVGSGVLRGSVSVPAKEGRARRKIISSCEAGSAREIKKRLNRKTNHAFPRAS